jgi:hypothetical protein
MNEEHTVESRALHFISERWRENIHGLNKKTHLKK